MQVPRPVMDVDAPEQAGARALKGHPFEVGGFVL